MSNIYKHDITSHQYFTFVSTSWFYYLWTKCHIFYYHIRQPFQGRADKEKLKVQAWVMFEGFNNRTFLLVIDKVHRGKSCFHALPQLFLISICLKIHRWGIKTLQRRTDAGELISMGSENIWPAAGQRCYLGPKALQLRACCHIWGSYSLLSVCLSHTLHPRADACT